MGRDFFTPESDGVWGRGIPGKKVGTLPQEKYSNQGMGNKGVGHEPAGNAI
jgi:hypothetical protein